MIATWNRHLCARDKFLVNYCTVSKEKMGFRRCVFAIFVRAQIRFPPIFIFIFTIFHLGPPTLLSFHQKNIYLETLIWKLKVEKIIAKNDYSSIYLCNNYLINFFFSFSSNVDFYPLSKAMLIISITGIKLFLSYMGCKVFEYYKSWFSNSKKAREKLRNPFARCCISFGKKRF